LNRVLKLLPIFLRKLVPWGKWGFPDNITFLTQKVIEQFSVGKKIISVFFDIASAFDKVWHRGLLIKLIAIKTPYYLLCIISAFLEDRKFTVKINSSTSDMKSASAGVPQGGVLSPTLFSIFINDLPLTNIKNESFSMLFADDLVCSFVYKDKHIAQSKVEEHLKKLEMWSNKWRLTFAPKNSHGVSEVCRRFYQLNALNNAF
jgi:retron-type reverse transcriptase